MIVSCQFPLQTVVKQVLRETLATPCINVTDEK